MSRDPVMSWNRWPVLSDQTVVDIWDRHQFLPELDKPFIAFGNGRSYSDVCLNEGGYLLQTRRLDKFISFDVASGLLKCESGVLLSEILSLIVPHGWFLPTTPGTRYVTLGGAIANDVHGKNHHVAGSFGHHVLRLALRRSSGEVIICGPDLEQEWFSATVGGLGLTGIILWAELRLARIESETMLVEARRFSALDAFWQMNEEAGRDWPYTVAWLDCASARTSQTRGVLFCGRHASAGAGSARGRTRTWRVPLQLPFSAVNRVTARFLNAWTYHGERDAETKLTHYEPYFYPLDGILDWNRMYGPGGFFQYQCVVPPKDGPAAVTGILGRVARSRESSFLAVLKTFGNVPSLGMLSFPRPGATLAVDMPNRGKSTLRLMADLDSIVLEAGGALYPAKDPRMPARLFRAAFGRASEFSRYVDPMASSGFWRRVSA